MAASDWMGYHNRFIERPRQEGMAIMRARREYAQSQRTQGMSDPAAEGMAGFNEPAAGPKGEFDIGDVG
jgi:hypothetical protein